MASWSGRSNSKQTFFTNTLAVAIRIVVYFVCDPIVLGNRMDLSTPVARFQMQKEILFLKASASSNASYLHMQSPLTVEVVSLLSENVLEDFFSCPAFALLLFSICVDLSIAQLLQVLTRSQARCHLSKVLTGPAAVSAVYLFSPFSIACCAALSFHNVFFFALASVIFFSLRKQTICCVVSLGMACLVIPFGPASMMLGASWGIYVLQEVVCSNGCVAFGFVCAKFHFHPRPFRVYGNRFFAFCATCIVLIVVLSFYTIGSSSSWQSAKRSFTGPMSIRDLAPTVGPFWYIFTLAFNRFKILFLVIFHTCPILFSFPLFVLIGRHRPQGPLAYLCGMVAIICLFAPYPTANDFTFMVTLLLIQSDFIAENHFIIVVAMCVASLGLSLQPVMYFLWIGQNTGNANFVYFSFLTYHASAGIMVSEWFSGGLQLRKRVDSMDFVASLVNSAIKSHRASGDETIQRKSYFHT